MPVVEIAAGVALKYFADNIVKPISRKLFKNSKDFTNKNDFLGNATTQYLYKIYENYNKVRVFGMNEPVPLDTMFVNVNIKETLSNQRKINLEKIDIEKFLREYSHDKATKTKKGIDAFNAFDKYIVLGKPGAGKTTYLKSLALQNVKTNSAVIDRKIPIFIELKRLADSNKNLHEFIYNEFDKYQLPADEYNLFIDQLLIDGKCVILLDGFDEVVHERKSDLISEINDFTVKYNSNKFVISCRIAAYNHCFIDYKNVEIADFNDEQIERFICNWFSGKIEKSKECWSELNDNNHKSIKELAKSPLLLTLLCINYEESLDFSNYRSEIYENAINALLKKWDSSRDIKRKEVFKEIYYKKMSNGNKEKLFKNIAYHSFEQNKLWFKRNEMTNLVANHMHNFADIDLGNITEIAENTLSNINAQHGILTEHAKNYYGFSHLTFQEYYTAKYINTALQKQIPQIVKQHSTKPKWKEVFLLLGEQLDDAEILVSSINNYANQIAINEAWIIKLLNGLDNVIQPNNLYNKLGSKGLAIYELFWYARSNERNYSIGRKFSAGLVPIMNILQKFIEQNFPHNAYVIKINEVKKLAKFLSNKGLNKQLYKDLSKHLNSYLYLSVLLFEILKKCNVSPSVRQHILDNLLEVPE